MLDLNCSNNSRRKGIPGGSFAGAFVFFGLLLFSGLALGKTVYVNGKVVSPGKGTSWASAYKYLRDALDNTRAGDQILIARGTYFPDDGASGSFGNREMSFELRGQQLFGGFAGTETSLSQRKPAANPTILSGAIWTGNNAIDFRSLHVIKVVLSSRLDGFIVENGHANGGHSWNYPNFPEYDRGGACYVLAGKVLTIANCTVRNNLALADGGAIYVEGESGKVVANNCYFQNNGIRLDYNITTGNSRGGAIKGNVDATGCVFTGNVADAHKAIGVASGGAISGEVVIATNCSFSSNRSGPGIPKADEVVEGGGGAVRTGKGVSTLANCVFVENTSEFRGGAVQGGIDRDTDSLFISNCTFLDNGTMWGSGSARSCNGMVRILNNLFWFTIGETEDGVDHKELILVGFKGAMRNSDENHPTPASAAPNLIRRGEEAITLGVIADLYLVSPALLFVDTDPMFVNVANPAGADGRWGTADDGLRLKPGSPAIGKALDPRIGRYVDLRPKDLADADGDGILTEKLPLDMAGYSRVQGGFVEIGAYELGNAVPFPEIVVLESGANLKDGGSRPFGKVARGKAKSMTFTIRNAGTNDLGNISVSIGGVKEIILKKAAYKPLAPGRTTTVTVTFKPKSAGNFKSKLRIFSNDADESPFDINLSGKCPAKKKTKKRKSSGPLAGGPAVSR